MPSRRLLLIRHAQAADAATDVDRPLTGRGARQAAAIGAWLEQAGLAPERVIVSPARRAAQTWELARAHLADVPPPITDARIYDNTTDAVLAVIRETPDDVMTVAVVGHNPSVGELTRILDDGQGCTHSGFPTGAVAVFVVATPFTALAPGDARLSDFAVPGG